MTFSLSELDYTLPKARIAQHPLDRRDASRLLVLRRTNGTVDDALVLDLPDRLRRGDLLVLNDTKVVPARFHALRASGGRVAGLFEHEEGPGVWRVMLTDSRRLQPGEALTVKNACGANMTMRLTEAYGSGRWCVEVNDKAPAAAVLDRIGKTPLPPYIRRDRIDEEPDDATDRQRYQTVYARRPGAIAAPTAGLHFTATLLDRLAVRGIEHTMVTLHVGVGTFHPIRARDIAEHKMHGEWFELGEAAAEAVGRCRRCGGRVIAVGTTSVRVLETAAGRSGQGDGLSPCRGTTDLFIHPPYRFRAVDGLITNFHLPGSTLLALVMALAGVEGTRRAYDHAIQHRYRFYSYGDAMLIL
ncbi:MAG: tRNA preQ1(34) S-adenosylmethionine ribosyltransferase-isomerase QueA [Phycisphaerae bacterium]